MAGPGASGDRVRAGGGGDRVRAEGEGDRGRWQFLLRTTLLFLAMCT